MRSRGRPVLGAIAGMLFGIFISIDLFVLGLVPLDSNLLAVIPIIGIVVGIVLGIVAPLHRGAQKSRGRLPSVSEADARAA